MLASLISVFVAHHHIPEDIRDLICYPFPRVSVLRLEHDASCGDMRSVWSYIKGRVQHPCLPIEDDLYIPTGEIIVLAKGNQDPHPFLSRHQLKISYHPKFNPSMFYLKPCNPRDVYLPDLLQQILRDEFVFGAELGYLTITDTKHEVPL
jgi:hypothetical protein